MYRNCKEIKLIFVWKKKKKSNISGSVVCRLIAITLTLVSRSMAYPIDVDCVCHTELVQFAGRRSYRE